MFHSVLYRDVFKNKNTVPIHRKVKVYDKNSIQTQWVNALLHFASNEPRFSREGSYCAMTGRDFLSKKGKACNL